MHLKGMQLICSISKTSRKLPEEVEIDVLAQLPPHEVDAYSFVSRARNALVEAHGARLPKHSIKLYPGEYYFIRDEACCLQFAWFEEWPPKGRRYRRGVTAEKLGALLESVRLARIHCVQLTECPQLVEFIAVLREKGVGVPVEVVELRNANEQFTSARLGELLHVVVEVLKPACLEARGTDRRIFNDEFLALYRHVPHFVYHLPEFISYHALDFLLRGAYGGRAVFYVRDYKQTMGSPAISSAVNDFVRRIVSDFQNPTTECHFPKADFLLDIDRCCKRYKGQYSTGWECILGPPHEARRYVDEWKEAYGPPLHYDWLGDSEWQVWKVRGGGGGGSRWMRVMQQLKSEEEENNNGRLYSLMAHFKVFEGEGED